MSISRSIDIATSAEHLFAIYACVDSWPLWDPDLEAAGLDGPFRKGCTGWIKPRGAPRLKTRLVALAPNQSFTAESRLPLCRMEFMHVVKGIGVRTGEPADATDPQSRSGIEVTHAVRFRGLLAPLFRRLLGPQIRKSLPHALSGLKQYAERQPQT